MAVGVALSFLDRVEEEPETILPTLFVDWEELVPVRRNSSRGVGVPELVIN